MEMLLPEGWTPGGLEHARVSPGPTGLDQWHHGHDVSHRRSVDLLGCMYESTDEGARYLREHDRYSAGKHASGFVRHEPPD